MTPIDKKLNLVKIYCYVCHRFEIELKYLCERFSNNNQPEFTDVSKLKQLMSMFENSGIWKDIGTSQNALTLNKGEHSNLVWVDDMAVVTSTFKVDEQESGQLMVVGPSRMEYDRIVSLMEFMSDAIEKVYGKGGS